MRMICLTALALMDPSVASAHIVFTPPVANGNTYATALRVSHGCKGSPTVTLRVDIPAGVTAVPQDKPGWTTKVERNGGRVSAVIWAGHLAGDQADTFPLNISLKAPGPVYFPVVQTCESADARWTDIPAAGQNAHDLGHPAPVFDVSKAADMGGMKGMPR